MSIDQHPVKGGMTNSAIARLRSAARFAGFGAALFLLHVAQAGAYPVFPNAQTSVEGNTNNTFPFNLRNSALVSQRYQQAYGASEFPATVLITDLGFRPDGDFGNAFASTLPSILIQLSTRAGLVDGLDPDFTANVNPLTVATVFNGPLTLSSGFTGPSGGPKDFDIVINLQIPFLYDPTRGDLLLDVTNLGSGRTTQFDAHDAPGDSISRVYSRESLTSGFVDSTGLVTFFMSRGAAVPEPGTLSLVGLAMAGLWRCRRSVAAKG